MLSEDENACKSNKLVPNPHLISCNSYFYKRRVGSDIHLNSASEISCLFKRISETQNCHDSIVRLTKIATQQTFMMTPGLFDILFRVLDGGNAPNRLKPILINNKPVNRIIPSILPPTRISIPQNKIAVLDLIDRIASFPRYCAVSGLKKRHLLSLWNNFPNQLAVKALGKFIVWNLEYCQYILSLGLDNVMNMFSDNSAIFIWFLGGFTSFPELNVEILPYFEKFVVYSCLSDDPVVAKHAFDAVKLFVSNSNETKEWILSHQCLPLMLSHIPQDEKTFLLFEQLISVLINANNINSFLNNDGFITMLEIGIGSSNEEILVNVIKIISFIYKTGFTALIQKKRFDLLLYQICCMDTAFQTKIESLAAMCNYIASLSENEQLMYLSYDYLGIIQNTIECGNNEIVIDGARALYAIYLRAKKQNDDDLLDTVYAIADITQSNDSELISTVISMIE